MTSNYTPEERAAILATARETVERLADVEYKSGKFPDFPPPSGESRNQRVRRELTEQEAERERERHSVRGRPLTDAEAARLRHWLLNLADEQKEFLFQVVGEALAQFKQQLIEDIEDRINVEVGKLRAETHVQRSIDKGHVTELPAVPLRKQS